MKSNPSLPDEDHKMRRIRDGWNSRLDPMLGRTDTGAVKVIGQFLRRGNIVLPFAALFAFGSAGYVVYDSAQRRARPVCVNCERQKEIAEEIYGTKPAKQLTGRMMP